MFAQLVSRWVESTNRAVIHLYKLVGFVVLMAILVGLISFFSVHLFYLFDHTWLSPIILGPRHEKVVEISAQIAGQTYQRDRMVAERQEIEDEAHQTKALLALQTELVERYERVVEAGRRNAEQDARGLRRLRGRFRRKQKLLAADRGRFRDHAKSRLAQRSEAGLATGEEVVAAEHQLSELAASELQLEQERLRLASEARALEARLAGVSPDGVELERQLAVARIEAEGLKRRLARTDGRLETLDKAVGRYDRLLADLEGSPYLRASQGQVTVAFVPYENLDAMEPGETVYGCLLHLIFCREVGKVVAVVDGEVTARHPLTQQNLRGQMVEVTLKDGSWAEESALFAGARPLLLF